MLLSLYFKVCYAQISLTDFWNRRCIFNLGIVIDFRCKGIYGSATVFFLFVVSVFFHLCDLPRYVLPHHFQTTFDNKNGYQHVLLHSSSQAYFGFQWQGFYFLFCTLPFGWKARTFIYHKLSLAVLGAARFIGVTVLQYLNDWHISQLFTAPLWMTRGPSFQRALAAAYIMSYLPIEAGYFIDLDKLQSTPLTCACFLGFVCKSLRQAFVILHNKRNKFVTLREDILSSPPFVSRKTFQRFSGKVISISLAIPGSKLYVRKVFKVISHHSGSFRPTVKLEASLRAEIEYWRLLDHLKDCF